MILDSSDFASIPGLTLATLTECADGVGTLSLEFCGFGPDWLAYMEPVTVMHRGRVLFHGKVTSYARQNHGGEVSCAATVSNLIWLLDHQTLGAQIAEVKAAAANAAGGGLRAAANAAMTSWATIAESCRIEAPGWVVNEDGSEAQECIISLDISRAHYSFGAWIERERAITAWTALLQMKTSNPDCVFRVNYTTGAVEVISLREAEVVTWDSGQMGLLFASEISPRYEEAITGVAVMVQWSGEVSSGVAVRTFPSDLDLSQIGVKIFTATVENALQAGAQLAHLAKQCEAYYEAANVLQWGGSVSARLADVPVSPLCACLNVSGEGTHASWHEMGAMVTEVVWDFVERTCTLTLGYTVEDPDLHELSFGSGGDGASTSTQQGGGAWSLEQTGDDDGSGGGWLLSTTTTEASTSTAGASTSTGGATGVSTSTGGSGSEPPGGVESMSTTTTTTEGESTTTRATTTMPPTDGVSTSTAGAASGGSGDDEGSDDDDGSGGSGGSRPSTSTEALSSSQGGSGDAGSGSGGAGSGSGGSGAGGCDCAARWLDLQAWQGALEERLAQLEGALAGSGGSAACGCQGELAELEGRLAAVEGRSISFDSRWFTVSGQNVSFRSARVREAVDGIITGVSVEVSASGLVESTAFGSIAVDTSGGGDLGGEASFSSSVHY